MKFINTLIDIIITAVGISLLAGFAYFIYTSGMAEGFTFTMPTLDGFSLDKTQIQGYAIAIFGLVIGVCLFKAAVTTDHSKMA